MQIKRLSDDISIVLFASIIVGTYVFLLMPLVVTLSMSLDSRSYLGSFPPSGLSGKWYRSFFSSGTYMSALRNSAFIAATAACVSTLIGTPTAVFLKRHSFPGIDSLAAFFLSPLIVPGVIIGFSLLVMLSTLGIYNGFVRLLLGHLIITVPYTIRTTLASLEGIDPRLEEAAQNLGATERAAFFEITLPLARTGIVAGAIFAFALSMDEIAVSVFLVDPDSKTLPVALLSNMRGQFDLTLAAASGVLILFTILLVFWLDRLLGLEKLAGFGVYSLTRHRR
jgi:putative spermidine/putrescine transport system permease protein